MAWLIGNVTCYHVGSTHSEPLSTDRAGWRIFLHRDQRRVAYRDYNGPALVRGGAGTGKTVVAMHRAKHLADQIAADAARSSERVLFTTFTTNLAIDIRSNMKTLCPEHLEETNPRIEVINLDRWVSRFLKRKKFPREIVYFGGNRECLDQIWREVLDTHSLPELSEEFTRAEWEQVVQAKGVMIFQRGEGGRARVEWLLAVKAQGTQLSDVGILLRTNSQIDQLTRKLSD